MSCCEARKGSRLTSFQPFLLRRGWTWLTARPPHSVKRGKAANDVGSTASPLWQGAANKGARWRPASIVLWAVLPGGPETPPFPSPAPPGHCRSFLGGRGSSCWAPRSRRARALFLPSLAPHALRGEGGRSEGAVRRLLQRVRESETRAPGIADSTARERRRRQDGGGPSGTCREWSAREGGQEGCVWRLNLRVSLRRGETGGT